MSSLPSTSGRQACLPEGFVRTPCLNKHVRCGFAQRHQPVKHLHAAVSGWSTSSEEEREMNYTPQSPATLEEESHRVGVLLLNLGGPETLDDVQPFLYNLFADPDIIRLPAGAQFLQPLIAQVISTFRSPKSKEGYEAIGGGSPLRRITEEQAEALAKSLQRKGLPAHTYVAMRYWKPFTGWLLCLSILYFISTSLVYYNRTLSNRKIQEEK